MHAWFLHVYATARKSVDALICLLDGHPTARTRSSSKRTGISECTRVRFIKARNQDSGYFWTISFLTILHKKQLITQNNPVLIKDFLHTIFKYLSTHNSNGACHAGTVSIEFESDESLLKGDSMIVVAVQIANSWDCIVLSVVWNVLPTSFQRGFGVSYKKNAVLR